MPKIYSNYLTMERPDNVKFENMTEAEHKETPSDPYNEKVVDFNMGVTAHNKEVVATIDCPHRAVFNLRLVLILIIVVLLLLMIILYLPMLTSYLIL